MRVPRLSYHQTISVAVETTYTILVSTVTALITLLAPLAEQLQQRVTHLRSDNGLTQKIEPESDR
jgi:hypothetical protein